MLKQLLVMAVLAALTCRGFCAAPQIEFSAPAGWQLEREPTATKHMYWLRRSAAKQPRCSLGLGAEDATSLVQAQTAILSRLRSMLAGPTEPKIRRTTIRSRSGVPILRADIIFDFYSQPQYRRGAVYPVRGVYYSFRSSRDGRVYTLECWPDLRYGAYFDRALDDLARSISL